MLKKVSLAFLKQLIITLDVVDECIK